MTSNFGQTLEALLSDDFASAALSVGTADALHVLLGRRKEVLNLREDLKSGSITTAQLAEFVDDLLKQFQTGVRFIGDIPFSAIAVALEPMQTEYAHKYVAKLASLKARELPLSRRIAQIVQRERAARLGGLTNARFPIASPTPAPLSLISNPHRLRTTLGQPPKQKVA